MVKKSLVSGGAFTRARGRCDSAGSGRAEPAPAGGTDMPDTQGLNRGGSNHCSEEPGRWFWECSSPHDYDCPDCLRKARQVLCYMLAARLPRRRAPGSRLLWWRSINASLRLFAYQPLRVGKKRLILSFVHCSIGNVELR